MEKQKAQMRVEERDKRAEELKNQMMNVIPEEIEEAPDDTLPFEIPGIETAEEEPLQEIEEEITEETEEIIQKPEIDKEIKEEVEEKKEKKKTDKQVSLFSF